VLFLIKAIVKVNIMHNIPSVITSISKNSGNGLPISYNYAYQR